MSIRLPRFAAATTATILLATSLAIASAPSVSAIDPLVFDGSTQENAAASCFEVKQVNPSATDGIYWLHTPELGAPGKFWCDQTTDGGGWVLVARGLDNWTFNTHGQNPVYAESVLANNPDGTDAFSVSALPGRTIDGLLDGGAVAALADGVRVKRAANTGGTSWQELRLKLETVTTWTWGFGGGLRTTDTIMNGVSYGPSHTRDTATSHRGFSPGSLAGYNNNKRLITGESSSLGWKMGWAYGATVCGSSSSTSYLYSTGSSNCYAKPFTQVFLRPQLTQASLSWTAIGQNPFAGETEPDIVSRRPQTLLGGVSGYDTSSNWSGHEVPVWAIAEIGSTIYVGGMFTTVEDLENNTTVSQPYLAAFERDTGRWIPSFTPTVNGQVYDLHATPDGRLAVAGQFTGINGVADTAGFTVLDPTSGAPDPAWKSSIANSSPWVQALDSDGTYLYLAGDFSFMQRDGESDYRVFRVARVNALTGTVDWAWRPGANFKVIDIDIDGDRAHLAGSFSAIANETDTGRRTSVDLVTGAPIGGLAPYEPTQSTQNRWYQQGIIAAGDKVFAVGSQHNFHMLDRSTFALEASHVTYSGGDYQSVAVRNGVVYTTCHCSAWNYAGTNDFDAFGVDSTAASKINYGLAYDATTGEILPWVPEIKVSNRREGPFEAFVDSQSCLWLGGDTVSGVWNGSGYDAAPGFSRHCPVDTTAPPTPNNFTATYQNGNAVLTWSTVSDPSGVKYEVWRDDRVHAVVGNNGYTDTDITGSHTYAVRAVDKAGNGTPAGNKSTSTTPKIVSVVAPIEFVAPDATWAYHDADTAPGTGWYLPGFDTSSWSTGPASLGFGDGDETTTVNGAALTLQAVTTFSATQQQLDASPVVTIPVIADDGAVVYLNGTLIDAWNITGQFPYDHNMFATTSLFGAAERTPRQVHVPTELLELGTNTLAVEVHQAWRNNPDGHLAVSAASNPNLPNDAIAPQSTNITATATSPTAIQLSWPAASDNGVISGYLVERTGGWSRYVRGAGNHALTDGGLSPDTLYEYFVTPYDTAGNVGGTTTAQTTTPTSTPANEVLAPNATWAYHYASGGLAAGWEQPAYNDASWPTGPALLGFGDPDIATVISSGPAPRPLTAYVRSTFTLPALNTMSALTVELIRDDGAVVYINGVEIGRDNMPAGAPTPGTFALTEIASANERVPVVFSVPTSALVAGTNTIAVEVHANYAATPDLAVGVRAETVPA